jgi:hypothetical protein
MERYLHLFEDTIEAKYKFNNLKQIFCKNHLSAFQFDVVYTRIFDTAKGIEHIFVGKDKGDILRGSRYNRIFLNCKIDDELYSTVLLPAIVSSTKKYYNEFNYQYNNQ